MTDSKPTVHKFSDSGLAYDACQCNSQIKTGDTLLIGSERVVGLAWTWPVAVTPEFGRLHWPDPASDIDSLIREAGWSEQQVANAVAIAMARGFGVAASFRRWMQK